MDNEMKFRAWDDKNKKMIYSKDIYHDDGIAEKYVQVFDESGDLLIIDTEDNDRELKLLQSTGLKDLNGTELYEGDILKTRTRGFVAVRIELGNAMVTYQSGVNTRTTLVLSSFLDKYKVKVIGNIYENMELLEVK